MSGVSFSDLESYGNLRELYKDDLQYQERITNSAWEFIRDAGKNEVNFDGNYWNVGTQFTLNRLA